MCIKTAVFWICPPSEIVACGYLENLPALFSNGGSNVRAQNVISPFGFGSGKAIGPALALIVLAVRQMRGSGSKSLNNSKADPCDLSYRVGPPISQAPGRRLLIPDRRQN